MVGMVVMFVNTINLSNFIHGEKFEGYSRSRSQESAVHQIIVDLSKFEICGAGFTKDLVTFNCQSK